MTISSIGAYGNVSSLNLLRLLSGGGNSSGSATSAGGTTIEDSLDISSQALWKSAQGPGKPKEFEDLEDALKSGNLEDAKKAYATIQQHFQEMSQSGLFKAENDGLSGKIEALGKALDSGDLSKAKEAWSSLDTAFKSHGPGLKPPPREASEAGAASSSTLSASQLEDLLLAIKSGSLLNDQGNFGTDSSTT